MTALQTGNLEGLDILAASSLAAQVELASSELAKVQSEGLSIQDPIFDNDGNEVGQVTRKNPRAELTFKLLEMVGHTADQQGLTRKSKGERERDQSIGGYLGALADLQKKHNAAVALPGAPE